MLDRFVRALVAAGADLATIYPAALLLLWATPPLEGSGLCRTCAARNHKMFLGAGGFRHVNRRGKDGSPRCWLCVRQQHRHERLGELSATVRGRGDRRRRRFLATLDHRGGGLPDGFRRYRPRAARRSRDRRPAPGSLRPPSDPRRSPARRAPQSRFDTSCCRAARSAVLPPSRSSPSAGWSVAGRAPALSRVRSVPQRARETALPSLCSRSDAETCADCGRGELVLDEAGRCRECPRATPAVARSATARSA